MLSKLRFRPTLWPTLFSVPAFIVMIGLCVWQVQRMHWKEGLIAEREARVTAAPVALPAAGAGDVAGMEYRRVRLEGAFLHDQELYLGARSLNGNPGYHVLTPFALAEGGAVLVDRGWIPIERKPPETRAEGQVGVEIDYGDAHVGRLLQARQQDGGVDRGGDHHGRLALQHGVAGVELRFRGLVGLDGLHEILHARVRGAGAHALLHRTPERIGQRLQQHAVGGRIGRAGGWRESGGGDGDGRECGAAREYASFHAIILP